MRKFFTLLSVAALPMLAQAQSPRTVLLEHFTQASCGPCATYNPALNTILNANEEMIVAIKYQVSWPGVDPMNAHNPSEVQSRRSYYNVTGVPNSVIDGNHFNGNPAQVSFNTFNSRAAVPSPMTIKVTQSFSAGYDSVRVRAVVKQTANIPAGANLKLHLAVVERNIYFATAPGSNGERHFESVMKKMLPNASGTTLAPMNIGDSIVVVQSWKMANVFDIREVASVAFVQDASTKEVLQAGYAKPNFPFATTLNALNNIGSKIAGSNSTSTYDVKFKSKNPNADTYHFELDKSTLGAGWDAQFVINGTTYNDFVNLPLGPMDSLNIQVKIHTGSNPNEKGSVTLKSGSNTQFTNLTTSKKLTAYTKITTALINKKPTSYVPYIAALNASGTTTVNITEDEFSVMDPAGFTDANVDQLFVNTSDLYTAFLFSDAEINMLTNYLTSGGDLFISGQDIAYSAFGEPGSPAFKSFVNNYLGATYVSDGAAGPLPLNPFTTDQIFGGITPSTLNSQATYPDHVTVYTGAANAQPILMYGNDPADNAAIRNEGADWKLVYLAIRLESIASTTLRNELVDLSIDWFNGVLSSEELNNQLSDRMLKAYPNPANQVVNVELTDVTAPATLQVYDMLGRVVLTQPVAAGSSHLQLNTSTLTAGTYSYRLTGGVTTASRKLVVIR